MRPSGQFFVADLGGGAVGDIPVDNFFWKTNRGTRLRITAHGSRVYFDVGNKQALCKDFPDALRKLADQLELEARNRH